MMPDFDLHDWQEQMAEQAYQNSIAEEGYAAEQDRRAALTPEQRAEEDAARAETMAKLAAAGDLPF